MYNYVLYINIHVTLDQHRFELCGSTYTGFFPMNTPCTAAPLYPRVLYPRI